MKLLGARALAGTRDRGARLRPAAPQGTSDFGSVRRALRSLAAWSIFPVLVGGATAAAVGASRLAPAATLGLPGQANVGLAYVVILATAYALVAALERALPYRPEWNHPHGDLRTDWLHLFVTGPGSNQAAQVTLGAVGVTAAAWLAAHGAGGLWPARWPLVAQLFLAVLVAEFGHYWFHRLAHENGWVWRIHAAHHSAPRLYWLNATRFHPVDLFGLIFFQTLPLLLLGITAEALLMYGVFAAVYGQIQHSNIALRTGPLSWLFATPELHRWHHSTDPREGNHNYGAILILWDRLFGTCFWPRDRDFTAAVGIADMPAFPRDYVGHLLSPLRWKEIAARSRA